jgi:hypothetical protein
MAYVVSWTGSASESRPQINSALLATAHAHFCVHLQPGIELICRGIHGKAVLCLLAPVQVSVAESDRDPSMLLQYIVWDCMRAISNMPTAT